MSHPRIKTGHAANERIPAHIIADHDWVRLRQNELREVYGDCYLIVYQKQVYGTGKTRQAALEDAERNLPPEIGEIQEIVESIHQRPMLFTYFRRAK